MDDIERKVMEEAGFVIGNYEDFLGLSDTERHVVELRIEINRLRSAIRLHRDQEGDDRCILDDDRLYEVLPETRPVKRRLPPCFPTQCKAFYNLRRDKEFERVDSLYEGWDNDRPYLSEVEIKRLIELLEMVPSFADSYEVQGFIHRLKKGLSDAPR